MTEHASRTASAGEPAPETTLRRLASPKVEYVEIDGETVVYDCTNNALHLLDPIGTLVWMLLDGKASLRDTSDELAEAFARPPEEVFEEVSVFARHLEGVALVERVP